MSPKVLHENGHSYKNSISHTKEKSDTDDDSSDAKSKRCEQLKKRCLAELNTLMSSSALYTSKDLELERRGIDKYAEDQETDELQYSLERIPKVKGRLERVKSDCIAQLSTAKSSGLITTATEQYWLRKLSSDKYHWSEKEDFVQNKLPRLVHNWSVLSRDIATVKSLVGKNRMLAEIPEVQKVIGKKTTLKGYKEWRNAVSEALGAMEAHERLQENLFQDAKELLQAAVDLDCLSSKKVGMWLHRIFKSHASNEKIAAFVKGKGPSSLSEMIKRWSNVRKRYGEIEKERNKNKRNEPRGFHFVKTEKFLEWHYTKRLAYVEEAEKRFVDIDKENPILLAIRRELDSEDWESAAAIIKQAEAEPLSSSDQEKLKSMKWYLREHRSKSWEATLLPTKEQEEDPRAELDALISALPTALQPLYKNAIRVGKFYCLAALMYNRVWCHEKGHVLNGNKEIHLRESSVEDTKHILEQGDQGGLRNAAVSAYHEPSMRGYANTGINAPQILHVGSGGQGALVAKMMSEDGERFRYWTTLIPEGVDYGTHSYVVKTLNHQIKSCLRKIEAGSMPTIKSKSTPTNTTPGQAA